ncbi:MAG: exodeoxyribonuclease VII small subunit [Clostridia bacterium]
MEEKSFESYINELDDVTKRLTAGKLPLNDMVNLYEKGMELAKICMDMLKNYSGRIEILRDGSLEAFDGEMKGNNENDDI